MRQRGADGDEPRQVRIFRTEPVTNPRTHAGSHKVGGARVQLK